VNAATAKIMAAALVNRDRFMTYTPSVFQAIDLKTHKVQQCFGRESLNLVHNADVRQAAMNGRSSRSVGQHARESPSRWPAVSFDFCESKWGLPNANLQF